VAFAKSPAKAMRHHRAAPTEYTDNRQEAAPARDTVASARGFELADARTAPQPVQARPVQHASAPADARVQANPPPRRSQAAPAIAADPVALPHSPKAVARLSGDRRDHQKGPSEEPDSNEAAIAPDARTAIPSSKSGQRRDAVPDYIPFRKASLEPPPQQHTQPDRVSSRRAPPGIGVAPAAKVPAGSARLASGPPPAKPSAAPRPRPASSAPYLGEKAAASAYYVEAGIFPERPLAERLAAILNDIAPTSIEAVTHQGRLAHRVRLGPFPEGQAANAAAARIRAAGLTSARLEGGT
jgi:hypothetical protein